MSKALITGGTSGIGLATAEILHARGYQVAVTGSSDASVENAKSTLPEDVIVIRADAGDLHAVADLSEFVRDQWGSLDFLFLNAGGFHPVPLPTVDVEDFEREVAINFKGPYFTVQRLLPHFSRGGSIVFTVGVGAHRGAAGASLGTATRGALLALLPNFAVELAPQGVRVNAVSPGVTDTPLFTKLGATDSMREAMSKSIPLGRLGTGADVAAAVAFLASPEAAYITGQEITVAGGYGLSA